MGEEASSEAVVAPNEAMGDEEVSVTVVETVVTVTEEVVETVTVTEEVRRMETEGEGEGEGEEKSVGKRAREEQNGADVKEVAGKEDGDAPSSKKAKVEDGGEGEKAVAEDEKKPGGGVPVQLGPKLFHSSIEMFTYFYDLLHGWVSNIDINKYEYMVLLDLISKGHRDAEAKIGVGIKSFQIRFHPGWHSRCYYLVRTDGSVDDFSYRKCVDKIMPLPESLFSPSGDLIVEKLFGSEEDKWARKGKAKGGADNGRGFKGRGHGGRGGRGGGGRGGKIGRGRW